MTPGPRRRAGKPASAGRGTYLGRAGGLAIALGLAVAIANSPGTALGDSGKPGSSAGSSPGKGSSAASSPSAPSRKPSTIGAIGRAAPGLPGPVPQFVAVPARRAPVGPMPTTAGARGVAVTVGVAATPVHGLAINAPSVDASTADVAAAGAAVTQSAARPTSLVTRPAPGPAVVNTPAAPAKIVAGIVASLLSAVGLGPHAANGPATPPPPPTLWALLGWVRREIGTLSTTTTTATATPSPTTTSPLGTPEQIAAEQLASQAVNTPVVKLAEGVLAAAWLIDAQIEFGLVGGPDQTNLAQLNEAVTEYAMSAAMEQQSLDPNNPKVLELVMPPHSWYGETSPGSRVLYDNPDTVYRFISVNAASSYVITGRFAGGIPADTNFSVISGLGGTTVANLNGQQIHVAPDGTFTITVSSAPAAPGQTNHIQLPANATAIIARNTLSDWNTQEPMSLSIQRVSGPPDSLFSQLGGYDIPVIGPLLSNSPLLGPLLSAIPAFSSPPTVLVAGETAVLMGLGLLLEPEYMAVATTSPATGQLHGPNVLSPPAHNATFLATQLQSNGYFELSNDQALVITVNPGNAGYFDVPVTNDWTITNNYWDQQTSLNSAQAVPNPDGTYTLVVSPTDPGVANWVSTGGLNQGTLSIRFQDFNPNSTATPTVSAQVVSLDQLASFLPPGTAQVGPAQREAQIDARQRGYNNRFAPYPQP